MTSYLCESEVETFKMATSILLKFLTLEWDISRTIWHNDVSEGSFYCIFGALSFEGNLFFEWSCPLSFISKSCTLWVTEEGSVGSFLASIHLEMVSPHAACLLVIALLYMCTLSD